MLYLASKSPRRRELLGHLGVDFEVIDVDVAEVRGSGETALDYVARVARDKALAGLAQVADEPGAVVIGADTEVILDDAVFGKPVDADDAAGMLMRLSDRTHDAVSAVTVVSTSRELSAVCVSAVTFAALDAAAITRYLATGEAMGKAGAYGIQGAAQAFIAHLSGSHSGVMGLPLHETAALLRDIGLIDGMDAR